MFDTAELLRKMKKQRQFYRITAADMSILLGLDNNGWKSFENGTHPEKPQANLIALTFNVHTFYQILLNTSDHTISLLGQNKYDRLFARVRREREDIDKKVAEYKNAMSSAWIFDKDETVNQD